MINNKNKNQIINNDKNIINEANATSISASKGGKKNGSVVLEHQHKKILPSMRLKRFWKRLHNHHYHHEHAGRSFNHIRHIDEEDEAWKTRSCGSTSSIDRVTDHYSDSNDPFMTRSSKLFLSPQVNLRRYDHRMIHHETTLEETIGLREEEEERQRLAEQVHDAISISDGSGGGTSVPVVVQVEPPTLDLKSLEHYLLHHHHTVGNTSKKNKKPTTMLETMEQLLNGEDSIQLDGFAKRPSKEILKSDHHAEDMKPLHPVLRKVPVAHCA